MAGKGKKEKGYKAHKRSQKRKQPGGKRRGKNVVFLCTEVLKEVWIHTDEVKHTGVITFVTKSGLELRRALVYTWFPQGLWTVKYAKKNKPGQTYAEVIKGEDVDTYLVNRLIQMSKNKTIFLYSFIVEGKLDFDQMIECLYQTASDRAIVFRVTYASVVGEGTGLKIPQKLLTDDYIAALKNEIVARIFLIMLEHFAGISINEKIAAGGISRKEYRKIIKLKSKNPDLDPKTIARVTCQGAYEFGTSGGGPSEYLTLMVETLFYQRKRKNPLAVNNQLEIAKGLIRVKSGIEEDIGIKQRGNSMLLLYDKFGNAIPAYVGYMDKYYRNLDLDKVPAIQIKVGDSGLADFMRVLEQVFAYPTRETYVFMACIGEFYHFIIPEIGRLYGGEIQKKVMAMLPMAIGFFVIHAVVGALAKRGNAIAAAIIVMAKAVGYILQIDMSLAVGKKMAMAGQHYGQMEKIHRKTPKEKGKEKLTTLSKYHLEMGTRYLIDAMSDLIAQGVFWAGIKLGTKSAGAVAKGIKLVKTRNQARLEITVKNGQIVKIRAIKGKKIIEIPTQAPKIEPPPKVTSGTGGGKAKGSKGSTAKKGGAERTTPTGKKLKAIDGGKSSKSKSKSGEGKKDSGGGSKDGTGGKGGKKGERTTPTGKKLKIVDSPPLENAGRNMGRRQKTHTPKSGKTVKISEYQYKSTDPKNRPASSEAVSGMPDAHLKAAIDLAKKQNVMVVIRTTTPKGVSLIKAGHPPKGKDLIAINTSKTTGKVTCTTRQQRAIALKEGYHVVGKDGFAYNAKGQKLMEGGKPKRFDMKDPANAKGQVIDPKTKKAVVGDYDLQDVIRPGSPGRNLAAVPEKVTGDVVGPDIKKFADAYNAKLRASGDVNRVVHGADAQFMQFRHFRKQSFKGDAIGILPDGRVVYFSQAGLANFYKSIGRSRLDLGSSKVQLKPYKK